MRNITVAVATYNRADYLEYLATSLQESVDINRIHLRIYDDHSTRLSRSQIAAIVPFATEIVVRPVNLKADRNMKVIFEDFLKTEDDLLLLCDSDLILRPGWLDLLLELMPQTDGVLSLYNSRLHPFLDEQPDVPTSRFGSKRELGGAGCAFSRRRVEDIVDEFAGLENCEAFDWAWSAFLRQKRFRLCCVYDSYIQHIGVIGQNNHGRLSAYDYGLNFYPESRANQQILIRFIDSLFQSQEMWERYHEKEAVLNIIGRNKEEAILRLPADGRKAWMQRIKIRVKHAIKRRVMKLFASPPPPR